MGKDSVELLSRFAYKPNELKYCGPNDANPILRQYIINKASLDQTKERLLKFEAVKPYVNLIINKTDKKFWDYEVIEAYCIGNSLLDIFNQNDMQQLVDKLVNPLPDRLKEKYRLVPNGFPHHSFHVLYVGVGIVSGKVLTNLENMDKCLVTWAKINEINENNLVVTRKKLVYNNKFELIDSDEYVQYDKEILNEVKVGDFVAVHWNFASKKLTNLELNNLEKYTLKSIALVNSNSS